MTAGDKQTAVITLRLPAADRDELKRRASQSKTSLNNYLSQRLGLVSGVCQICGRNDEMPATAFTEWEDSAQTLCCDCAEYLQKNSRWPAATKEASS